MAIKKLFDGVFDIDSVSTKGNKSDELEDPIRYSIRVKCSGTIDRDKVAFLFGMPNTEGAFASLAELMPGLWNDEGKPYDAEGGHIPSAEFLGCKVTIFEKLGDKPAMNQIVGSFKDVELRSFTLHPNYGNTFNISFAVFTPDVDQKDGSDIGLLSVHVKKEVFIKVERPGDLFDPKPEPVGGDD